MKSFLIACAIAIIVAVIGGVVMSNMNTPADEAFANSATVRLDANG
jgi:hypothetical protein